MQPNSPLNKTTLLLALICFAFAACDEPSSDGDPPPDMSDAKPDLASATATIAPLRYGRAALASAVASDGTVYAIAGFDQLLNRANVEAYTPATNTWTERKALPQRIFFTSAHALADGTILVFGGEAEGVMLDTIYAYSPTTDTWTTRKPMPKRRTGMMSAVAKSGRIYFVGGASPDDPELSDTSVDGCSSLVESYDPATETWTEHKRLTKPICFGSMVAATDGTLYLTGGITTTEWLGGLSSYDEATDTWTKRASPKLLRRGSAFVASGDRLYVIGGDYGPDATETVEVYSPASNKWTTAAPLPYSRTFAIGAALPDGRVLIAGGRHGEQGTSVSGQQMFRTAIALTPATNMWTPDDGPFKLE